MSENKGNMVPVDPDMIEETATGKEDNDRRSGPDRGRHDGRTFKNRNGGKEGRRHDLC